MAKTSRDVAREETKAKIVEAALQAFAAHGFEGASTRQIAGIAGVNQGLITYHFGSKDNLWREAMDALFWPLAEEVARELASLAEATPRERIRGMLTFFVRYAARRPEQMRIMVQEGKSTNERTTWLVERHVKPLYEGLTVLLDDAQARGIMARVPTINMFYTFIGATSLIFTHEAECELLSGRSPLDEDMIEAHARAVCTILMLPET